jgi:response regulator NasT
VVLCTGDVEGLRDGVVEESGAVAILAKPVSLALLDCTVRLAAARAREFAALRADCVDVRRQLAERKLIERAKGILMRRTGTSEQEAYRILQRSSQDKATPMIKLAQAVLDSEPGAAVRR